MMFSPGIKKTSFLHAGFTLIEMSMVLVIVGLIVGGVLVGQELVVSAGVRSQITQIEKYNTAVNAFRNKYGYLPGDIPDPYASNFGFQSRGSFGGEGDGNGVLEGNCTNAAGANDGFRQGDGELATMWVDLTTAGLIDQGISYNGARYPNPTTIPSPTVTLNTGPSIRQWLPAAKLGQNNFVYAFSLAGINYWGVSRVDVIGCAVESGTTPNLTVQQAYMVDAKADDGLPQSGNIKACYVNHQVVAYQGVWAAGGTIQGASGGANCVSTTAATNYATTNCYDNADSNGNGVAGAVQKYATSRNASYTNCAFSARFQ